MSSPGTLRTLRYFAVFNTTVAKCGLYGTSSVQGLKIKGIVQSCELQKISNHILTPLQSGFVHDDSTTYQLLHTFHQFYEAVDNGKEVRAVLCDISKAFDRVWPKG